MPVRNRDGPPNDDPDNWYGPSHNSSVPRHRNMFRDLMDHPSDEDEDSYEEASDGVHEVYDDSENDDSEEGSYDSDSDDVNPLFHEDVSELDDDDIIQSEFDEDDVMESQMLMDQLADRMNAPGARARNPMFEMFASMLEQNPDVAELFERMRSSGPPGRGGNATYRYPFDAESEDATIFPFPLPHFRQNSIGPVRYDADYMEALERNTEEQVTIMRDANVSPEELYDGMETFRQNSSLSTQAAIAACIICLRDRPENMHFVVFQFISRLFSLNSVVMEITAVPIVLLTKEFIKLFRDDEEGRFVVDCLECFKTFVEFQPIAIDPLMEGDFFDILEKQLQETVFANGLESSASLLDLIAAENPDAEVLGNVALRLLGSYDFLEGFCRPKIRNLVKRLVAYAEPSDESFISEVRNVMAAYGDEFSEIKGEVAVWGALNDHPDWLTRPELIVFSKSILSEDKKLVDRNFKIIEKLVKEKNVMVFDPQFLLNFTATTANDKYENDLDIGKHVFSIMPLYFKQIQEFTKYPFSLLDADKPASEAHLKRELSPEFMEVIKGSPEGPRILFLSFPLLKSMGEAPPHAFPQVNFFEVLASIIHIQRVCFPETFADVVNSTDIVDFIRAELEDPKRSIADLAALGLCVLELGYDENLFPSLCRVPIARIAKAKIAHRLPDVTPIHELKDGVSEAICIRHVHIRLEKFEQKVNVPAFDKVKEIVNLIGTPSYNSEAYKSCSSEDLMKAEFLEKLNCEPDLAPYIDENLVNTLQNIILSFTPFDFETFDKPAVSYIRDTINKHSMRPGDMVGKINYNFMNPNIKDVSVVLPAAPFGDFNEVAASLKSIGIQRNYENREFRYMVEGCYMKFYYNGKEIPRFLPYIALMEYIKIVGSIDIGVTLFNIDDPVGDAEARESVLSRNTFNTEHLPESCIPAFELLKSLYEANRRLNYKVPIEKFRLKKFESIFDSIQVNAGVAKSFTIPDWMFTIAMDYPFLISTRHRTMFLHNTVFSVGHPRGLKYLAELPFAPKPPPLPSLKFKIERKMILKTCMKLLDATDKKPNKMEILFANEEGTGRGPTAEFYALSYAAFNDVNNGMWVATPEGLMPKFYGDKVPETIVDRFKSLGQLVTRSMCDDHLMDLKISPLFFDEIVNSRLDDEQQMRKYDPEIANTLSVLKNASDKDIAAMELTFVEPRSGLDLIENGSATEVTAENAQEYVDAIYDAYLGSGIYAQVNAFRKGLLGKLMKRNLKIYSALEWSALCGNVESEAWDLKHLEEHVTIGEEGTMELKVLKSDVIKYMSKLDDIGRRKFLIFCTGSPRLNEFGFSGLDPKFRILPKVVENQGNPDDILPSVMTCVNALKLPMYSSYDVLERKLDYAIQEGSGAFPLS